MVLDPFRVRLRHILRHSKGEQELEDQFVPFSGGRRYLFAFLRQEDRAVGLGGDVAFALESLDRFGNRDMAHPQPLRQVHRPRLTGFGDQGFDQFHVVFRVLTAVIFAGALESVGG